MSATGATGGEGARTHVQVLANSIVASILILLHTKLLFSRQGGKEERCFSYGGDVGDLLTVGIVAYVLDSVPMGSVLFEGGYYDISICGRYHMGSITDNFDTLSTTATTPPSPQTPLPPSWASSPNRNRASSHPRPSASFPPAPTAASRPRVSWRACLAPSRSL